MSWRPRTTHAATKPTPARILTNVEAPVSSASGSTAERVALRTVVAAAAEGVNGLVAVEPAAPSGRVAAPMGESGWVGGLRETVAFGRTPVFAADKGAVGEAVPKGAFAVFRGMVGAPIGELVVASFMVGAPAVGV